MPKHYFDGPAIADEYSKGCSAEPSTGAAVSSGTATVAVVEPPVAFLGSAFENWQTYLKASLVPLNSLLSSVECQRCSASQSSGQPHFAWESGSN